MFRLGLYICVTVFIASVGCQMFDPSTVNIKVSEDTPVGSVLATLHFDREDLPVDELVSFVISEEHYDTPIVLDGRTGQLILYQNLDYEEIINYNIRINALLDKTNEIISSVTVFIHIEDVNDNAPIITINTLTANGHVEVLENSQPGLFVAHVSVHDKDAGENAQVHCESYDPGFKLHQLNMFVTEYQIKSNRIFDREAKDTYEVKIACSDNGNPSLRTTKTIMVDIMDENDHVPFIHIDPNDYYIQENAQPGGYVANLNVSDLDTGANGEVSCDIDNENFVIGTEYSHVFNADFIVTTARVLDREQNHEMSVIIMCKDHGDPSYTATATLVIEIGDANDNAPIIVVQSIKPSAGGDSATIATHLPAGELVANVMVSDIDPEFNKLVDIELRCDINDPNFELEHIRWDFYQLISRKIFDVDEQCVYRVEITCWEQDGSAKRSESKVALNIYVLDKDGDVLKVGEDVDEPTEVQPVGENVDESAEEPTEKGQSEKDRPSVELVARLASADNNSADYVVCMKDNDDVTLQRDEKGDYMVFSATVQCRFQQKSND